MKALLYFLRKIGIKTIKILKIISNASSLKNPDSLMYIHHKKCTIDARSQQSMLGALMRSYKSTSPSHLWWTDTFLLSDKRASVIISSPQSGWAPDLTLSRLLGWLSPPSSHCKGSCASKEWVEESSILSVKKLTQCTQNKTNRTSLLCGNLTTCAARFYGIFLAILHGLP